MDHKIYHSSCLVVLCASISVVHTFLVFWDGVCLYVYNELVSRRQSVTSSASFILEILLRILLERIKRSLYKFFLALYGFNNK